MDSETAGLKKFFVKLALFSFPFAALSIVYLVSDHFKVLRTYENYYVNCHIEPSRDYVSTEIYLKNRKATPYDSFIFGSSRSRAFRCQDWAAAEKDAVCFHFDAASENIYGLWAKLKLIDSKRDTIRQAILVVDHETFATAEDLKGHLFVKHPALSGRSWFSFQTLFFTAYFEKLFFVKFADFKLFKRWRPYMGDVIYQKPLKFDPITNDEGMDEARAAFAETKEYYIQRNKIFYSVERAPSGSAKPVLDSKRIAMLKDIREIFYRHQTRYRVIISPLYDQIYFNRADLKIIKEMFGAQNVLDYSGVNEFTEDVRNYYETSHYKPKVARKILKLL